MDTIFNKYKDYIILEKENKILREKQILLEKKIYRYKIFIFLQLSSSIFFMIFLKNKNKFKINLT